MAAVPQEYTVHCLIDEECDCAAVNSPFNYSMFMEGSLSIPAFQYCNGEPSLSCTEEHNSNEAPIVDNQLTVTWNARTVITQGDYRTKSTPANGDHDVLCYTTYFWRAHAVVMLNETAFVVVRGTYFLMHGTRAKTLNQFTTIPFFFSTKFHPF